MKRYLFILGLIFAENDYVYDRESNILYGKFQKYEMVINIKNIKNKNEFIANLKKLKLSFESKDLNSIISGLDENSVHYVHKNLISLYDKEILEKQFYLDRSIEFNLKDHSEDFQSESIKTLINRYYSKIVGKNQMSIQFSLQKKLDTYFGNSDSFAVIMDSATGEIYAISGNYNKINKLNNFGSFKKFFYIVNQFNANSSIKNITVKSSFLGLFSFNKSLDLKEYIVSDYDDARLASKNAVLKNLSLKVHNPVLLGKKEDYEEQFSDVNNFSMYMLHFLQLLQIISNDGAIHNLTLTYVPITKVLIGEKLIYNFDSDLFFHKIGGYINFHNQHSLYRKDGILIYVYNGFLPKEVCDNFVQKINSKN